jgi:hypothetical protein
MLSNNLKTKLSLLVLFVLATTISCSKNETGIVQNSIDFLSEQATTNKSSDDEYCNQYLATAYKKGADILQKKGMDGIKEPVILFAGFGMNISGKGPGGYGICWLEFGNDVKGFFILDKNNNELSLYPYIMKGPFLKNTVIKVASGNLILDKKVEISVDNVEKLGEINIEKVFFKNEPLLIGLILKDGTKTNAVQAYIREGLRNCISGKYEPN